MEWVTPADARGLEAFLDEYADSTDGEVKLGSAADRAASPQTLNGVPVICEVVGAIRKR